MTFEDPSKGDTVEVTHDNGMVVGEVEFRIGVEGDFGISIDAGPTELIYARTYAPEVYTYDGQTRDVLGEVESIKVVEE
jgi:hypothetical protein